MRLSLIEFPFFSKLISILLTKIARNIGTMGTKLQDNVCVPSLLLKLQ